MTSLFPGQASAADFPYTSGLSRGRFGVFRLPPGASLIPALHAFRRQSGAAAIAVVTCVGSLTRVLIRHANKPEATLYEGHFEITSLTGTIDPGGEHLHLTITDGEGHAFGGHLMAESAVYTTAEITVLLLDDLVFTREPCALSGYDELVIRPAPPIANAPSPEEPAQ